MTENAPDLIIIAEPHEAGIGMAVAHTAAARHVGVLLVTAADMLMERPRHDDVMVLRPRPIDIIQLACDDAVLITRARHDNRQHHFRKLHAARNVPKTQKGYKHGR